MDRFSQASHDEREQLIVEAARESGRRRQWENAGDDDREAAEEKATQVLLKVLSEKNRIHRAGRQSG